MQIGRSDILWNYAATFFRIASGILLFPFVLRLMPTETVAFWNIFITITSLIGLLDFGFNPSFSRNLAYIFSGVRNLKVKGLETINSNEVDYGLLKGVITAMRWFYLRVALLLFIILISLGTFYIHVLLKNYNGDVWEIYFSWMLLIIINTYNLYTLYYESLLIGKGLVKKAKQIIIISQIIYLLVAFVLILAKYNLVAIISAQALSVIIVRVLSFKSFFTKEIKLSLRKAVPRPRKEVLQAISPNAIKVGLTSLGGFMVQKSAILIGSIYLSLNEIASYGITMQFIGIITGLAGIYTTTYQPKIAQLRVEQNINEIKELYLKGQMILLITYIMGSVILLFLGKFGLNLIKSQTELMPVALISLALFISFLENNHAVAGGILLSNNEVPFYKSSLLAGGITMILLILMFCFSKLGLWAMVLSPGIAHLYNNWKWPHEVFIQLNITSRDIGKVFVSMLKLKI